MSVYNEFKRKYLFENGFLLEEEFNEVLESFPGLDFDLDVIPIYGDATYDKNMVGEEILYSKLWKEGLDTDEMALETWSVDVDNREIYLEYEVSSGQIVPVDQIKGYFPNYSVEIQIISNQE